MVLDLYQNHRFLPTLHFCFKVSCYLNSVSKGVSNERHLCMCVCARVCVRAHVPNAQCEGLCLTAKVHFQRRKRERKLHVIGREEWRKCLPRPNSADFCSMIHSISNLTRVKSHKAEVLPSRFCRDQVNHLFNWLCSFGFPKWRPGKPLLTFSLNPFPFEKSFFPLPEGSWTD